MILCNVMVPNGFLVGHITFVLKRGKSADYCASYRPITIASSVSKVIRYVIFYELLRYAVLGILSCRSNKVCAVILPINSVEDCGANQIGFSKGLVCQHAHWILSDAC